MSSIQTFLTYASNIIKEITATTSSSGANSAGNIVALNGNGLIDSTMLPVSNQIFAGGASTLAASQIIGSFVLPAASNLNTNLSGSIGSCVTTATATATFGIYHVPSGSDIQTQIGSIVFAASSYTPTFSTVSGATLSFNVGDTLQIIAPSTVDSTLANVTISLLIVPSENILSVSGGASTLPASSIVLSYCSTVAGEVPINFTGSVGSCMTTATATTTFDVYHVPSGTNTQTQIGSIVFAASSYTPTFSTVSGATLSFNVGDTLQIIAPSTVDSTLANVSFTIVGVN